MQLTGHRNKFPQKPNKSSTIHLIQNSATHRMGSEINKAHTQGTDDNISTLVAPHSSECHITHT